MGQATLIDALNDQDGKEIVAEIEDMLASWNGKARYANEIAGLCDELYEITGFNHTVARDTIR